MYVYIYIYIVIPIYRVAEADSSSPRPMARGDDGGRGDAGGRPGRSEQFIANVKYMSPAHMYFHYSSKMGVNKFLGFIIILSIYQHKIQFWMYLNLDMVAPKPLRGHLPNRVSVFTRTRPARDIPILRRK